MNVKIANLVAIQFGVFVGMMSWLVYSHFDSPKPMRTAEERPKSPMTSVPAFAPVLDSAEQSPRTPDYRADAERAAPSVADQPVPVVQYEYSPEAVQQYSALAAQMYYRQIAPRPAVNAAPASVPVSANAPTYAPVEQAPAVAPVAYEEQPQTVAYEEPLPYVAYAQAYPVIAYPARSFGRRCPPPRRHHVLSPSTHRRHDRARPRLSAARESCPPRSLGVVQRQKSDALSCRPAQNFRHRGKR